MADKRDQRTWVVLELTSKGEFLVREGTLERHIRRHLGIDTDHPVHRYFLAAKQTEFAVGGATGALLHIGRELADTPA